MNTTLRMPLQAAPIDRSPSAAAQSGSGVEASQDWGQILGGLATTLIPLLGSIL